MTRFVRSILPKRNPRNVPLDIFQAGLDYPYPGASEDESLDIAERDRRVRANMAYEETLPRYSVRIANAREQYQGIFREAIRSIGERLYKIKSRNLTDPQNPKQWHELGEELAGAVRDGLAARFTRIVDDYELFEPRKRYRTSFGPRASLRYYEADELRDEYENRATLLGRWIRARAAFEAKRHGDFQFHHPEAARKNTQEAETALQESQSSVNHIQSLMAGDQMLAASQQVIPLIRHLADIAVKLGDPSLTKAIGYFAFATVTALRADAKKAETLAKKGEKGVSRKLAREAAIREGDEPKRNPFAGYRNFAACVRDKAKNKRNYSPGGLCATIERKAHRNPVAFTMFAETILGR